jgi:putative phosphoesterase
MLLSKKQQDRLQKDHLVGVISDTHGLIRPEALKALEGVSLIIHAGDIGTPDVLHRLENIAPVIAVRGNTDRDGWAFKLPFTETVEIKGVFLYVLHDLDKLDLDPAASGFSAVINGHTHQPAIEKTGKILFLNPGSAGPKRFDLPVTVALLRMMNNSLKAELLMLSV